MRYLNFQLKGKKGETIEGIVESDNTSLVIRAAGQVVATVKCVDGKVEVSASTPPPAAIHSDVPPLTSGHEPNEGPEHAKPAHGDR